MFPANAFNRAYGFSVRCVRNQKAAKVTVNASRNTTLTSGLVGLWSFDGKETKWATGQALDGSGGGNTGSLVGMSTTTSPVAGKLGQALSFSGNNYASIANTITTRSVSFWVKPTTNTASMLNLTATAYITATGGTISATGFTSPTIYVNGVAGGVLAAGVWNHIVVTDTANTSADAITIGKANGAYTTGSIDDVRVYNRALSPSEVKLLYNSGK